MAQSINCATWYGDIRVLWNGVAPGRRALFLIHGAGGQAMDWPYEWREPQADAALLGIAARNRGAWISDRPVFAMDLPGHGRSGGEANESVEDYADAAGAVIDALELSKPVIGGHSMGGAIAQVLGRRRGDGLGGLILLGTSSRLPVTDQILEGLQGDFDATAAMIVKFCWARETSEYYRVVGRRRMRDAGPAVTYADFFACSRFDARDWLGEISCPVLVISGSKDKMVAPDKSAAMTAALGNARIVEIAGGGHFFHVERPAETARAIKAFCDGLG